MKVVIEVELGEVIELLTWKLKASESAYRVIKLT